MIIGDWNANLGVSGVSLFGPTMEDFCDENNLTISTKHILPADTYSYTNRGSDNISKSWLDHVVSSKDTHMAIENIDMLYNVKDEDHIPFVVHLKVDNIPKFSSESNDVLPKIN